MDENLGELPQSDNVTIAPKIKVADDDHITNYVSNHKKRAANDAIWLSLGVTVFGLFLFTVIMSIFSLCLLASTFWQRRRPTGTSVVVGICTAVANCVLIGIRLIS